MLSACHSIVRIGVGEVHRHRFPLDRGHYARVVIRQGAADLRAAIRDPAGRVVADVDARLDGPESVSIEADTSGTYQVEVRLVDAARAADRYTIVLEMARVAGPLDKTRIAAERTSTEAKRLYDQGTSPSRQQAATRLEEALSLWRAARDRFGEASTLGYLGDVTLLSGDARKALALYERALAICRELGEVAQEASALVNIAAAHSALGDKVRAVQIYDEARERARAAGDLRVEAIALSNVGGVHAQMGATDLALARAGEALPIWRRLRDRHWEGQTLNTLASVSATRGEHQRALDYFAAALALWRASGDRRGEAVALSNVGTVLFLLGDFRQAAAHQERAAAALDALGDKRNKASVLVGLARTLDQAERKDAALERFDEAVGLAREVGDRRGEGVALVGRAGLLLARGQREEARHAYEEGLALSRAAGDRLREAVALNGLGQVHHAKGDYAHAIDLHGEALVLARQAGDRNGEAAALLHLARNERDLERLAEARAHAEEALALVESVRGSVARHELRASYLATKRDFYELEIDLLMRLHRQEPSAGFDAEALRASERARARGLVELLIEARAEIRQGGNPALVDRERGLQRAINAAAQRQMALLGNKQTEGQAAALAVSLEALLSEYQAVQGAIRSASPRYAALTQPTPPTLTELRALLDPDTALVEFALGRERSYAWVLAQTTIHSAELPGRDAIEAAARRLHQALGNRAPRTPAAPGSAAARAPEHERAAAALSVLVLDPLAGRLTSKRLVIVGDGALDYVAFGALPLPRRGANRVAAASLPLLATHEVLALPSASVLSVLRREAREWTSTDTSVAVLADPVFHADDVRVRRGRGPVQRGAQPEQGGIGASVRSLARAIDESGLVPGGRLPRLPFTRREARAILDLLPPRRALSALDFAASRATATHPDLRRYRIVHIASHALVNATHPELSGIALSLVDEKGAPQDGFLRLHENLQPRSAGQSHRVERLSVGPRSRDSRRRAHRPDAWIHVRRRASGRRESVASRR